ncbi:cupin domain-containing protein [Aliiglaciecola sp.]|nr:cupin domain-containing protein [Aliiglaciecola sp.]
MTYVLHSLNKSDFLTQYWQKKPVVIRSGFDNFVDPICENELAGLAQEEDIDSRIISCENKLWTMTHGPINDFETACKGAWSLLVQSVDCYSKSAKSLLDSFDFIPQWRTDDLMVSYSVANAGVGPHLDQYDVFIVQGKGSRRWQVGEKKQYTSHFPTAGLTQIESFTPIIDEVLLPGDIIYIPPGYPHNGIALEPCMNYSVGFRAPTQVQLLNAFADYAQANEIFNQRYQDPQLSLRTNTFEMNNSEQSRFKEMFQQMINSPHFDDFIGDFFTVNPQEDEYDTDQSTLFSEQDVAQLLLEEVAFYPHLSRKIMQTKININNENHVVTWVNQQKIETLKNETNWLNSMLHADYLDNQQKIYHENSLFFIQIATKLINSGAWYPESEHT